MADAIARALADLERQLSALDPQVRKNLLSETAHHLEDLRLAHDGDAEAAVLEFGDIRKVGAALRRECGPRRSRALAVLTFTGPMLLVAGLNSYGLGKPFEFVWFVPALLALYAVVAYRARRFAWREIGTGALVAAGVTWLFLAAATIDMGEKDGYGLLLAVNAQETMARARTVHATGNAWLPPLKTMQRAYGKGDTESLALLHNPEGYLVPSVPTQTFQTVAAALENSSGLPTTRVQNLGKAKRVWSTTGETTLNATRQATEDARRAAVEYPVTVPTLASRFVPQLGGYFQTASQVAAYAFCLGTGIHLLMLGLRFVVEALWRRLRLGVAG